MGVSADIKEQILLVAKKRGLEGSSNGTISKKPKYQTSKDNIPLVDLKANRAAIQEEVHETIDAVWESCYFIGGPEVAKFEKEFAAFVGAKDCIGLNSGTDALVLAFKALGIGPGDEVITQGNTFVATCLGITNNGADVVLCDINPELRTIDCSQIESKVKYHHDVKGGNSRLDTVQAAILSVKLRHLDDCNANRRLISKRYTELLAGVGDMVLPKVSPDVDAVR